MKKRRRFTAEFKARVALQALRGDKTIREIAAIRSELLLGCRRNQWSNVVVTRITDFERRQMAALRTELDEEYEAQIGLNRPASKAQPPTRLSSSSRT